MSNLSMKDYNFRYHYGNEANQFNFIRIPKTLITNSAFKKLSYGSKFLYGILLDRMNLSMKNGWFDEENRVYIIFTIKEVMEELNVCKTTAIGFFSELENFGLIEKKRRPNLPAIIFVKNFIIPDEPEPGRKNPHEREEREIGETAWIHTDTDQDSRFPEVDKMDFQTKKRIWNMTKIQGSLQNGLPEEQKIDFQKAEASNRAKIQGSPFCRLPEVHYSDPNNTNNNKTDIYTSSSICKPASKGDDNYKKKVSLILSDDEIGQLRWYFSNGLFDNVYSSLKSIATQLENGTLRRVQMQGKLLDEDEIIKIFEEKLDFEAIKSILNNIQVNGKENIYNMQSYILTCIYNYTRNNSYRPDRELREFERSYEYNDPQKMRELEKLLLSS